MRNVTIDNTNTTAIEYYPPLCNGTGWDHNESQYAAYSVQNTYAWCSGSYSARATLKFTGVAVYYTCPLFAAADSMMIKLDDRPFDTVSLTSPSGSPIMSKVVWSVVDLPNTQHRVELLPGQYDGDIGFVSVDAFIVTEADPPPRGSNSSKAKKSKNIGIGVGAGLGALLLVLGLLAFFYFRKKRRTPAGANPHPFITTSATGTTQPFISPAQTGTTQPFISPAATGTSSATPYDPNAGYNQPAYDPNAGYNQPAFNMPDPNMAYYSQPPRQSVVYNGMPPQPTTPNSMTTTTNPNTPIYV